MADVIHWTPEMDAYLAETAPGRPRKETKELFEGRFGMPLTEGQLANRMFKLGVRAGVNPGRFVKGQPSSVKGKTWDERGFGEEARKGCSKSWFKKGGVPKNGARIPIGTERVNRDGYVEVKVSMSSGIPNTNKCWRLKQRVVWEQANGKPVPDNCIVAFCDHDRTNFDPENLALVPRSLWGTMRLRGLPYNDRAGLEACKALAMLQKKTCDAERRHHVCRACGRAYEAEYPHQARCRECIDAGRQATSRAKSVYKPKGVGTCAVCGAEYTMTHVNQKRCPECIREDRKEGKRA